MELLTYRELSALLSIPLGTLYSMVARGEIPHVRFGKRLVRFRRSEVEAWVTSATVARGSMRRGAR